MPIHVVCPCGKKLNAAEKYAGKKVKCPACQQPLRIPLPAGAGPPPIPRRPAAPSGDVLNQMEFPAAGAPSPGFSPYAGGAASPTFSPPHAAPGRKQGKTRPSGPWPKSFKEAVYGLATGGFLWMIFALMGVYIAATDMSGRGLDEFGKAICVMFGIISFLGYLGAVLLACRIPGARVFGFIVASLFITQFPLGLVVTVITFKGLLASETNQYLGG